jgi:hypothetical protein
VNLDKAWRIFAVKPYKLETREGAMRIKGLKWWKLGGGTLLAGVVVVYCFFQTELYFYSITPEHEFSPQDSPPAPDYTKLTNWAMHPGKDRVMSTAAVANQPVDVFYIHPTSLRTAEVWNEWIDPESSTELFQWSKQNQASIFEDCCRIFAPHYRQATLASYWTGEDGRRAKELAYSDVLKAFDQFIADTGANRPFFLVGHSQGSDHGLRLLKDRILGNRLEKRVIASYLIGRPMPEKALAQTHPGLRVCNRPDDVNCLISWATFQSGVDPQSFLSSMEWHYQGGYRRVTDAQQFICVNPLSWTAGRDSATAEKHDGAVFYDEPELVAVMEHMTDAECNDQVLLVGDLSDQLEHAWSGNYHLYDFNIFYQDIKQNVRQRIMSYIHQKAGQSIQQAMQ